MRGKPKCTIEQIRKVAEERGFELLETEYINNGTHLLRIPYWEDIENTIKLYFKENFNDYVS